MVLILIALLVWRPDLEMPSFLAGRTEAKSPDVPTQSAIAAQLPPFTPDLPINAIVRYIDPHTIIPTRPRETVEVYTVEAGDSLFAIGKSYNIEPESILWANYDVLRDNPEELSIGMKLKIPPTDGILYQWKEGDTVEAIAAKFKANVETLLAWPGNNLDMANPQIAKDTLVMIPGGSREFVSWIVPTIPRGRAGVSTNIPGACDTGEGGLIGGGAFLWPTPGSHVLSGNDYWSGHLGIDIAGTQGTPVYASDSGVVVYAGSIGGGYGVMVMIDHGNGWQTLYAHLSNFTVRCGSSVAQGGVIGHVGSTGNSTGAHLHFETRYLGGFVNPWSVVQ